MHESMVKAYCYNFRTITAICSGVQIFRSLTVVLMNVYSNDPKFSDRYASANSADSDQGLHCLPFRLHRLNSLLYGRATYFKFYSDYNRFFGCPNI